MKNNSSMVRGERRKRSPPDGASVSKPPQNRGLRIVSPWSSLPLERFFHEENYFCPILVQPLQEEEQTLTRTVICQENSLLEMNRKGEVNCSRRIPELFSYHLIKDCSKLFLQQNEGSRIRATTFTRLMDYNNGLIISSFFLSLLSFIFQNGKILKVVS